MDVVNSTVCFLRLMRLKPYPVRNPGRFLQTIGVLFPTAASQLLFPPQWMPTGDRQCISHGKIISGDNTPRELPRNFLVAGT